MKESIEQAIKKVLEKIGITPKAISISYPEFADQGDFATSAALAHAKEAKMKPLDLAEKIAEELKAQKIEGVESVSAVAPGFINFKLSREYFAAQVDIILQAKNNVGKNTDLNGKKIMVEFTDPNLFKVFHIGHLMSNTIGESLSRIMEESGADVLRGCYQSDIGLNVAKAIWGMKQKEADMPVPTALLAEKIAFITEGYVAGASAYENKDSKKEIDDLNKLIYKKDASVVELYDWGKKASLEHFEELYKTLGTKFDRNYLESEVADDGLTIVKKFQKKGVFEESEGATVFKGEKFGLHTRVFITSQGLPTYETKELGLTAKKFKTETLDQSIVITAHEQDDYFSVILKALEQIDPVSAQKTKHISHGMMRFADRKMSSRTGNVITAESLITDTRQAVIEKMKDREMSEDEKQITATHVAVAAIKYSILKQSPGNDIVYDIANSTSFEGDSGPYLQYAHTRALSVIAKAKREGLVASADKSAKNISLVEKLLPRFSDVVSRANAQLAPQLVVTYLTELASAFNTFYAETKIVDAAGLETSYNLALTEAFATIMKNGLNLLGIRAPEKM